MSINDRSANNNSLCEKSMKMVVNILKLSSFSIAKMSLGATGHPVTTKNLANVTGSVLAANSTLPSQIPGSRRSQEPQSSSKPISFVMQPRGDSGSSYVIHELHNSLIDGKASDYIRKVHAKNRFNVQEASHLSTYILPPPPRAMK